MIETIFKGKNNIILQKENYNQNDLDQSVTVSGILEIQENNSFGFLRGKNCLSSNEDVYVSPAQIRRFNLLTGDKLEERLENLKKEKNLKL